MVIFPGYRRPMVQTKPEPGTIFRLDTDSIRSKKCAPPHAAEEHPATVYRNPNPLDHAEKIAAGEAQRCQGCTVPTLTRVFTPLDITALGPLVPPPRRSRR